MDSVTRWLAQDEAWLRAHMARNEKTPRDCPVPRGSLRFDTLPSRDAQPEAA